MDSSPNPSGSNRKSREYADLDASIRRVSERVSAKVAARERARQNARNRWLAVAAGIVLVLALFCWFAPQSGGYEQLSDDLRLHLPADDVGPSRSLTSTTKDALLSATLKAYHDKDYATARTGWQQLADQQTGSLAYRYRFYEGTSAWLNGEPELAISTLKPLLAVDDLTDLLRHRISYVLGMAYVDVDDLTAAEEMLKAVAKRSDTLARRAKQMLTAITG